MSGSPIELAFNNIVVFQVVIFVFLILVLKPLLFDPMLKVFALREERTDGARETARELEEEAGELLTRYEGELRRVSHAAAEERDRLRAEATKLEAQILNEARVAAAARLVAPATGTVKIAISPWGLVEVDGASSGAAPPITELTLGEGRHQIVIRNGDNPPHTVSVNVIAGQTITVRHKFGS